VTLARDPQAALMGAGNDNTNTAHREGQGMIDTNAPHLGQQFLPGQTCDYPHCDICYPPCEDDHTCDERWFRGGHVCPGCA
jgi:hypothetical protein